MLLQQINESELRKSVPSGCICTPGCFYDKTKISKEYLGVDYFITLGNKIFATLKGKSAIEYTWGADFKSAFIFVLARQIF